ncbi:hypothetical protein JKP88DRAFT_306403 [Tribonema minus]|uniref:WW domain-containing protein n=1 Tax=Tribonema minus TaxID=303371 RepID=A0A835Z6W4_9STRA|nr:hypothetical protein JKP88DRAFT_306403 [Tribonema minus]
MTQLGLPALRPLSAEPLSALYVSKSPHHGGGGGGGGGSSTHPGSGGRDSPTHRYHHHHRHHHQQQQQQQHQQQRGSGQARLAAALALYQRSLRLDGAAGTVSRTSPGRARPRRVAGGGTGGVGGSTSVERCREGAARCCEVEAAPAFAVSQHSHHAVVLDSGILSVAAPPPPRAEPQHRQAARAMEEGWTSQLVDFVKAHGLERALVPVHARLAKMCMNFTLQRQRSARERAWWLWRDLTFARSKLQHEDGQDGPTAIATYAKEQSVTLLAEVCARHESAVVHARLRRWRTLCVQEKTQRSAAARRAAAHVIVSALVRWRCERARALRAARAALLAQRRSSAERAKQQLSRYDTRSSAERTKQRAMAAVLQMEEQRQEDIKEAARILRSRRKYQHRTDCAQLLQAQWRRHQTRARLLRRAETEAAARALRRRTRNEELWHDVLRAPMQLRLQRWLNVAAVAAAAKHRAAAALDRRRYRQEIAAVLAAQTVAAIELQRRWRGFYGRWQYLETLWRVRRLQGWARAALSRWQLQSEIDARVTERRRRERAAAEERARQRCALLDAHARRLQRWGRRCLLRGCLRRRFGLRAERMRAARFARTRLLTAILIQQHTAWRLREFLLPAERCHLTHALRPHDVAARARAQCRALRTDVSDQQPAAFGRALARQDEERVDAASLLLLLRMSTAAASAAAAAAVRPLLLPRPLPLLPPPLLLLLLLLLQRLARVRRERRALTRALAARARLRLQQRDAVLRARRDAASATIAQAWRARHLRCELSARVTHTRLRREDAAARCLQRLCRHIVGARRLRDRFAVRRLIMDQAIALAEMSGASGLIARWYRRQHGQYHSILRTAARNNIARRERERAAAAHVNAQHAAALKLQRWWRQSAALWRLARRVRRGQARRDREALWRRREGAAAALQRWARRRAATAALAARFKAQAKKQGRALAAAHEAEARRLRDSAALDRQRHSEEKARLEAHLMLETSALKRTEEEKRAQMLAAWKVSFDKATKSNVYKNYITGETATAGPPGWQVNPADRWVVQEDEQGFKRHLDNVTGDLCWFPPEPGCKTLRAPLCDACFARAHPPPTLRHHAFAAPPTAKEPVPRGEAACVACLYRVATVFCRVCGGDALCARCSGALHRTGRRRAHALVACAEQRRGWQQRRGWEVGAPRDACGTYVLWQMVEARTDSEKTYYFNATTGESASEKPESLMLGGELDERRKCLEAREAASKHLTRAERLQQLLEQVVLERDNMQIELQQLKKDLETATADLEAARANAMLGTVETDKLTYRKELLLSRTQRRDLGQSVKLKTHGGGPGK